MATIMLLVLVLVVGIIMPLAERSRRRRRDERLSTYAPTLGAGPPTDITVPWSTRPQRGAEFTWRGLRAALVVEPWGRYEVNWVVLRGPSLPRIYARRETGLDRLGKRLGLNRETQTGDAGFDARVYLETDDPEALVQRALGSAEARAAVEALLAMQPYVRLGPDAAAVRVGGTLGVMPPREEVERALEALSALVTAVPAIDPRDLPAPSRRPGDVMATVAFAAFVVTLFGLYVLPIGYVDYRSPLLPADQDKAASVMGLVWLLLIPATWLRVRGHSRSFRNFLTVVLCSVPALLVLGPEVLFLANAAFDGSDAVAREAMIVRRHRGGGKVEHRYLDVRWWDEPHRVVEMQVSAATFRGLNTGDLMTLQTHAGAFGWPWTERLDLRRAAPSLAFTARVRSISGPARATVGATCAFAVSRRPTRAGYQCQTEVRCGGVWLYGGDTRGFFDCTFDEQRALVSGADPSGTRIDRDPGLSIDSHAGTMAIWDDPSHGSWRVELDVGLVR